MTQPGAPHATLPLGPAVPASTVSMPPRDFGPDGAPLPYSFDPDVIAVDPVVDRRAVV